MKDLKCGCESLNAQAKNCGADDRWKHTEEDGGLDMTVVRKTWRSIKLPFDVMSDMSVVCRCQLNSVKSAPLPPPKKK